MFFFLFFLNLIAIMSQGNIESNNIPNSCMQSYATILITQKIQHETRRP
jgi:hypothetical protein